MSDEKRRITCVLAVAANGDVLRSMIIYNRKEILNLESDDYETNPIFFWTKNGWMDSDLMILRFKRILLPHVKKKFLLDRFSAHVSKEFEEEWLFHDNIDLILISNGLTYLLQPLDVSVNKSFKVKVRNEWKLWLDNLVLKSLVRKKKQNKCSQHRRGKYNGNN